MLLVDLIVLAPFIIITVMAVVILLAIAFFRHHQLTTILTLTGLALAFVSLFAISPWLPRQVTPLLIMDGFTRFYLGLLLVASMAVTVLAYGYLGKRAGEHEEFYLLLLLATLGSAGLVASNHFASFFLGLEILSVSLYGFIAYLPTRRSIEAGLKYLILAAASAAFLLFGMGLIYAGLGTMEFSRFAVEISAVGPPSIPPRGGEEVGAGGTVASIILMLPGLAMIVVGVGFKLAVVPFHMWTPDIYEGAPAPVTAFIATVSKGAMFALLLRYFAPVNIYQNGALFWVFALIAAASMLFGNLLALLQNNVKRLLAYSSIAHLGYLLVAFLAGGSLGLTAVTYYLVAYIITLLGAFGVITVLSDEGGEPETLADYRGLFWERPWLAGIFTATLFSLAGIPLTAGFVGKFYLIAAGVGTALWSLVIVLVVGSAIGLFYYLRLVVTMYLPLSVEDPRSDAYRADTETAAGVSMAKPAVSLGGGLVLAGLTLLLVWFGVYPAPLIQLIQAMVTGFI